MMTDDEFDPLPADMMRARRRMTPGIYVHRRGIAKLEAVSGRVIHHIDGDPTNNDIDNLELRMTTQEERDRAAEARAGAGNMRRRAWAGDLIDPTAGSGLILRLAIERFAPSYGHWTKTWGMGSPPTEAESCAMHGDR